MTLAEFPTADDGAVAVDPWNYTQRLGVYKVLLNSTAQLGFGGSWGNPLWGLALQFAWQHDTGRLLGANDDAVSPLSWWATMNYFLSVVPFLAAVDEGVVRVPDGRPVRVLAPEGNLTALCCSVEECIVEAPRALLAWKAFFDYARTADVPAQDDALALLWEAHIHSLHEASPLAAPLLQELPGGRRGREAKCGR